MSRQNGSEGSRQKPKNSNAFFLKEEKVSTNGKGSGRLGWRGLITASAAVFALFLSATAIVRVFRTDIDKFLGTKSSKMVSADSPGEDLYAFKSDYGTTAALLNAIEDLGERMSEEGSVLLKNNGALPLSKDEITKVSLLGYSSYYPVQGGDMGSTLRENKGTDADTVNMVEAFTAKGFVLNPEAKNLYGRLKETIKASSVMPWGAVIDYYRAVAPSTSGTYRSQEPERNLLEEAEPGWFASLESYPVIIITLARAAGENANYTPGKAGINPEQKLNQTDPLGLSDSERSIIAAAAQAKNANGGKIIVLLNNASAMEIEEIKQNQAVDAILQIGLPGGYGFYGVADLLKGDANPSGRLTDTYAAVNANSPAAQNYGNLAYTNANREITMNSALVEAEGIYTGYKYYETRYADTVLGQGNSDSKRGSSTGGNWTYETEVSYPFGYGLSYTTFAQTLNSVKVNLGNQTITAEVTVANTGTLAGKDVVQLYASLPYTEYDIAQGIEKAAIQLVDYEKTPLLQPGATVNVTITADAELLASWDSGRENAVGTKGTYILDAGTYCFSLGNGAHEAVNNVLAVLGKSTADGMTAAGDPKKAQTWKLGSLNDTAFAAADNGTPVENRLADMDLNQYLPGTVTWLSRSDWEGTWPKTYRDITATAEMLDILDNDVYAFEEDKDADTIVFGTDNGLTLADLKGVENIDDPAWDLLIDQITLEEAMIRTGFGGTSTKAIESITSPEVIQNDGPNGIYSYPLGQYANKDTTTKDPYAVSADDPNLKYQFGTMPNATVIAQTFSKSLAAEFGAVMGNYSIWANLGIVWSAGTNLHRLPYNARNHEYYSEDPILSANQAAAFIAKGNEYGVIMAPKHYAFNDTEINRQGISVFMTEQKARETELRAFQPCIEKAGARGVMTAFNRIGVHTGNTHRGLLFGILRKEWGFTGLMSEDFIMNADFATLKEAVYAGVTMTTATGENSIDAVGKKWDYWTVENVSKDRDMKVALKNAMLWQNWAIANSNAMDGLSPASRIIPVRTWYDNGLLVLQLCFGILTLIALVKYVTITLAAPSPHRKED